VQPLVAVWRCAAELVTPCTVSFVEMSTLRQRHNNNDNESNESTATTTTTTATTDNATQDARRKRRCKTQMPQTTITTDRLTQRLPTFVKRAFVCAV